LDDERLCVVRGDGVAFARSFNPGFDVILVDGFDALGQSSELSTDQFYDDCLRILPSRGLMVVNLDTAHPAHSVYVQRISRAFEGNTLEVEVAERGNSIVFAGKDDCIHSIFMNCEVVQDRLSPELLSELASEFQHITQRAMMATRNAILNVELRGFL
jgi:predicted methyltransferase